jgi:hypothetical protein
MALLFIFQNEALIFDGNFWKRVETHSLVRNFRCLMCSTAGQHKTENKRRKKESDHKVRHGQGLEYKTPPKIGGVIFGRVKKNMRTTVADPH